MHLLARTGPGAFLVFALACGGATHDPPPSVDDPVVRPEAVATLSLPARSYALPNTFAADTGLFVAHTPTLGDLVGGSGGLYAAASGGLTQQTEAPVTGLAARDPEGVVITTASGVWLHTGAIAPSPLSEALQTMSVTALVEQSGDLWLGTAGALYQWQDGNLWSFDVADVQRIATFDGSPSVVMTTGSGVQVIRQDALGYKQDNLQDEVGLTLAYPLSDGSILGLDGPRALRRQLVGDGQVAWRPQALSPSPDDLGAANIEASAQDPARGSVWLVTPDGLYRIDGPQVALQPRPDGLGPVIAAAVDEIGALWLSDGATIHRVGRDSEPVTWQAQIADFAADNCQRCHNALGTGHPLETYDTWKDEVDQIISALDEGRMPLDGAALTGGSADTIRRWKEDGLLR